MLVLVVGKVLQVLLVYVTLAKLSHNFYILVVESNFDLTFQEFFDKL